MKVIYSSLEFPYGTKTITHIVGMFDRRVFGINNVWCDAHQRRCKTVIGSATFAVVNGEPKMTSSEVVEIK